MVEKLKELGVQFAKLKKDVKNGGDPVQAYRTGYVIAKQVIDFGMDKFNIDIEKVDARIRYLCERSKGGLLLNGDGNIEARDVVLTRISFIGQKEINAATRMEGWLVFLRSEFWWKFVDADDK